MPADYAGAVQAIKDRFTANWKVDGAALTPVGFVNEADPQMADEAGALIPWVLFEIVSSPSRIVGVGSAGNNNVLFPGLIKVHVFTPAQSGSGDGLAKALIAAEMFRNKTFFDDVTPGCFVRTGYRMDEQPRVDAGDVTSLDGNWFATTATIPFEYWHRA